MKRLCIVLALLMLTCNLIGCDEKQEPEKAQNLGIPAEDIKVGFIYVGAVADKGYTFTHDQARRKMAEKLNVKTVALENVTDDTKIEAVATALINQGCNVIYGTSYEQMKGLARASQKHPDVYFGHATGYMQFANMSNFMGRVYEARYLSGIVAGVNTKSDKIGYVAAMPIPEVIRGINAFALGVKSVNKEATIEVIWTGAWENPRAEKELALRLIDRGADIIAQHTNTHMPQVAAKERGVLAIGYSNSTRHLLPETYLTAPLFNWETFYIDDVSAIINGTWKSRTYYEGLSANMVALDDINTPLVRVGTQELVDKAKHAIVHKGFQIFSGPIYDNHGTLKVPEGGHMKAAEIQTMTFFVDNVFEYKNSNNTETP